VLTAACARDSLARVLAVKPPFSRFPSQGFLGLAWGSVTGGVTTLLGGARNPLAIGILREEYGLVINFMQWVVAALPISCLLLGAVLLVMMKFFPPEIRDVKPARDVLAAKVAALGKVSRKERKVLAVTLVTIGAWMVLGEKVGLATTALVTSKAERFDIARKLFGSVVDELREKAPCPVYVINESGVEEHTGNRTGSL
jgi:sodium-dependent dicarboxylate transporter 2/3/5